MKKDGLAESTVLSLIYNADISQEDDEEEEEEENVKAGKDGIDLRIKIEGVHREGWNPVLKPPYDILLRR